MSVRRLGPGDAAVAAAAARSVGAEGDLDPGPFLNTPGAVLFVAEEGTDTVGWAYGHELVHPEGELTMLLYAVDVVEPARRRGHGAALVTAFVEEARARGSTEVWVLTEGANQPAERLYASTAGVREPTDSVMFTWTLRPGHHSG